MATVSGQVLNTDGNGIANVLVTCQFLNGSQSVSSVTNSSGRYNLYNVDLSASILMSFRHPSYQDMTVYLSPDPSLTTYTYDITLPVAEKDTTPGTSSDNDESPDEQTSPVTRDPLFSGANARVYVIGKPGGQQLVELDIITINFTYQYPKLPLYGYKSVYMDGIAIGSVLVQGSFTLNMQDSFVLKKFIEKGLQSGFSYMFDHHNMQYRNGQFISYAPDNMNLMYQKAIPPIRIDIELLYSIDFSDPYSVNTGYRIRSAQIIEMGQVVTSTGEPVGESYTFLARQLEPISTLREEQ